jgi:Tol biopolymer transport system component
MMKIAAHALILMFLVGAAHAQLRVSAIEPVPLSPHRDWSYPRFSPDGKSLLLTTSSYAGIWVYSLRDKELRQVTSDPGSGYGFTLSPDGASLAYRRSHLDSKRRHRVQEIVLKDLHSGEEKVVGFGRRLSVPALSKKGLVFTEGKQMMSIPLPLEGESAGAAVLGIEETKIAVLREGVKSLIDPLGNGSYIWPSLSPDGTRIVAYEMDRGAFICDLDGNVLDRIGRRDAPAWTRDGAWLAYMDDRDDGLRVISSDIYCVSSDGKITVRLTNTPDVMEMNPQCSPTENKIVCNSLAGDIYVITYEERGE